MRSPLPLDHELILRALRMLADDLGRSGTRAEILLAGGAVMALLHDSSRITRDVDGVVESGHGPVMAAAQRVAAALHLPRGWLNEGVSTYLSAQPDPGQPVVFDHPHLTVSAVTTQHLFALKARAARAQDIPDLVMLADALGITTTPDAIALVEQFFPEDPLSDRATAVMEDLFRI